MAYKVFDPAENNGLFESNHESLSGQNQVISSNGQDSLNLPDESYIRDADFSRDGMDLVLETDHGTIVIENYFADATPPNLVAPNGLTLTPELVNSFTHGEQQYANAGNSMNDASPIGAVQEISGDVTVTRTNGTVETASIGTPIYQGDVIETDADGAVNIMFVDETTFAVSEDARLAIDEYVFDPATQSGSSNFSVLKGVFVFTSGLIGRDDPDDVEIDTPSGSIGIRGTIIAGNVDTGEITVIEGAIVLRDFSGNFVTLSNQYETARFMPESNTIEYMGEMSANDVVTKFTSVSNVNGTLFSSIQDSASDVQGSTQNVQAPVEAETQPEQNLVEDNVTNETKLLDPTMEMITSEEIVKSGTEEQIYDSLEPVLADDPILQPLVTSADGSTEEPLPPPPSSDIAAIFSVTVNRLAVEEHNTGVVEVAIVKGHFTTGMTLQLNGLSQSYFDVIRIDPITFKIVTKPNIILDTSSPIALDFTATDINGHVFSNIVDLNIIDESVAQFVGHSPNVTPSGPNAFSASDNNSWAHDFSKEFYDPGGKIASYSYELYDSSSTQISGFPTGPILNANITISGTMYLDFGNVTTDTYTLIVHAYDANGNLIDSTSNYTFETFNATSTTNTSLASSEIVSLGAGDDGASISGNNNRLYTNDGNDSVTITGSSNDVYTDQGQDTIVYNSGTGNHIFAGLDNDIFIVQSTAGIADLATGTSNLYFNGGGGYDKLKFASAGAIDFTAINDTYLHNFEVISTVQGSAQNNAITLSRSDVLAMTDENNRIVIEMDSNDTFDFVNDGTTTFIHHGTTADGAFNIYTDTTITLLVSTQGAMAAGSDLP
ncbi:MAG: FecR family protein [Alphaproteobacteria bacterium]|nr:FecR family protein [Alphaproteobacteria bacterium]